MRSRSLLMDRKGQCTALSTIKDLECSVNASGRSTTIFSATVSCEVLLEWSHELEIYHSPYRLDSRQWTPS